MLQIGAPAALKTGVMIREKANEFDKIQVNQTKSNLGNSFGKSNQKPKKLVKGRRSQPSIIGARWRNSRKAPLLATPVSSCKSPEVF